MTAAFGFIAVLAQISRNSLLIDLEIQDDKAFAEGLPQHAYQKYYRPPFIQVLKFLAKISGKRINCVKIISLMGGVRDFKHELLWLLVFY